MAGMGPAQSVPVSRYLSSVYDPDVDFVEGELEDRNVGGEEHAKLQHRLVRLLESAGWFATRRSRLRISPTRYRVPDVCVYRRKSEQFAAPPWIVMEILSPEDRMSRMQRKLEDYFTIDCPNIWILDPWLRKAYRFDGTSMVEVRELVSHDARMRFEVARLF